MLLDLVKANTEQHDKWVLQLAAALLGLSITFLEKIAPKPLADTLPFLGAGWVLLCTSVGGTLLSFLTGQRACKLGIDRLEELYRDETPEPTARWRELLSYNNITEGLNLLSYGTFVAGVVCIATFSWKNIQHKASSAEPPADVTSAP
ncbi:MAG TPA: hypothetical protein VL096_15460, partial [Pirellulaceae bacterium]|nr:hypothetical protein [Pirellulaceae bacterium]